MWAPQQFSRPTDSIQPGGSPFPAYPFKSIRSPSLGEKFNVGVHDAPAGKFQGEFTGGERTIANVDGMNKANWQVRMRFFGVAKIQPSKMCFCKKYIFCLLPLASFCCLYFF